MTPSLKQWGENEIVRRLTNLLPASDSLLVGPGDDCAVVKCDSHWDELLKTDVVVENIHFLNRESPEKIGRKALARALSDIAAMGGLPEHALVTLLADHSQPLEKLENIYRGLSQCAREYGLDIAGGETSSLPFPGLILNIALTGKIERGTALLRSGAQPSDLIAVTGTLGDSLSGHHLNFTPRLREARFLHKTGHIHAMMDLSDGLAQDLPRLAKASGLHFELSPEKLPLRGNATIEQALGDGEDYELLLTFAPEYNNELQTGWQNNFPETPLTIIGRMTAPPAGAAPENAPLPGGWQHFSPSL